MVLLLGLSAYWLFFVKQYVKDLKQQLDEVTQQINQEQDSIHIFRAELSYLRSPQRIAKLSDKYLRLESTRPSQMIANIDGLGSDLVLKNIGSVNDKTKIVTSQNYEKTKWRYKRGPGHKYLMEASIKH